MDPIAWLTFLWILVRGHGHGNGGGGLAPSPTPPPYNPVLDPIPGPRGPAPSPYPAPSPSPAPTPEPTPSPWPTPAPPTLPPFPSGWEPDNPPPAEVVRRATGLLPQLWAKGEGSTWQEMTGGRWITYRASRMNDANGKPTIKGVVAYRVKGGGSVTPPVPTPPAPTPPPQVVIPPVEPGADGFATWLAQAREAAQAAGLTLPTAFTDGQLVQLRAVYADWIADPPMSFDELAPFVDRLKAIVGLNAEPPRPTEPIEEVLPPFPSGWTPDTPVRTEVAQRANALLPVLWKKGEGATQAEKVGDRWVTFQAQKHGVMKGVTAYRIA